MKRPTSARIAHVEAARPPEPLAVTVESAAACTPRGMRALERLLEIGLAVDAEAKREGRSGS